MDVTAPRTYARLTVILVALIILVILLSAESQAATQQHVERAQVIAERVFRAPCGKVLVQFDQPRPSSLPEHTRAWAYRDQCLIEFAVPLGSLWSRYVCSTVLHEYGHLAGLSHSDNPRSVMYDGPRGIDKRCKSQTRGGRF